MHKTIKSTSAAPNQSVLGNISAPNEQVIRCKINGDDRLFFREAHVHKPVRKVPFVCLERTPSLSQSNHDHAPRIVDGDREQTQGCQDGVRSLAAGIHIRRQQGRDSDPVSTK